MTGGAAGEIHWLEQVHGTSVVVVERPGPDPEGGRCPTVLSGRGDALVSRVPSVALAVLTADCASVALASTSGVFAAVHAGWRGLTGGVVDEAVTTIRELGATDVVAALGPCIHVECYEFSEPDLASVCAVIGEHARGRTADGRPALDMPAAVSAVLARCGVKETAGVDACTACSPGYFSHRRRGDAGRQALLVWSSAGDRPTPLREDR